MEFKNEIVKCDESYEISNESKKVYETDHDIIRIFGGKIYLYNKGNKKFGIKYVPSIFKMTIGDLVNDKTRSFVENEPWISNIKRAMDATEDTNIFVNRQIEMIKNERKAITEDEKLDIIISKIDALLEMSGEKSNYPKMRTLKKMATKLKKK